jgi:hydrogenase maturation protease
MIKNGVTILGLGNILMQDEGVGVYSANLLKDNYNFSPDIKIIDGGTTGTDLLPYFEESDKILIIDAVNFEKDPGYIDVIENDNILTTITAKISLHHLGLSDVLSLIKLLGITPSEICLVGIQPVTMELGLDISNEMKKFSDKILETVISKLSSWGISCEKKTGS